MHIKEKAAIEQNPFFLALSVAPNEMRHLPKKLKLNYLFIHQHTP
jgi:hypothetical protein